MTARAVVVGAAIGGVRTARGLRTAGFDGEVVLLGDEPHEPYDKPPLSKALLAGTADPAVLLSREEARGSDIELRLGARAAGLDTDAGEVVLDDGRRVAYDELVVATGATARPSPWGRPPGVHVLRTLDDARALRADLLADAGTSHGHLVVVGSGFIGAEVTATARGLGVEATMVDPLDVPLSRLLGVELGRMFGDLHTRHGVATRFGVGVEAIHGERPALRVALTDGTELAASTVVVGIGAEPDTAWLTGSGLPLDDGVPCDEHGHVVGYHHIWSVGDVARWRHPRHGTARRAEHWTNALEQARVVAHNIVHPRDLRAHDPVEYVWSDQYDWKVQIAGAPSGTPRLVGDPGVDRRFAAVYGDAELTGVVAVNWPKAVVAARRSLPAGVSVDEFAGQLGS